jgi:hypothetical protein
LAKPVLIYFAFAYGIAWGGILLVVRAFTTPGEAASPTRVRLVFLPRLFAPSIAGVTMTALVDGRAEIKGLLSRMTQAPKLDLPMFFLVGRQDVNAVASLVERYYNM